MRLDTYSVKERLTAAAFALFNERGYERSTVDDIAERAGVGRTTFFRAFPSKEDVILPDHRVILGAAQARLATSTQETALVAVSEAAWLVFRHYLAEGELARTRYRLTSGVPVLRQREVASVLQYTSVLREFLHRWMGATPESGLRAELMATSVVAAHNYVLRRWLLGIAEEPEAEFDTAMAEVVRLFADASAGPAVPGEASLVIVRTTRDLDAVLPSLKKVLAGPT